MEWQAPLSQGDMRSLSVAVLKRQGNWTWKMVIDHPFGAGVMNGEKSHSILALVVKIVIDGFGQSA